MILLFFKVISWFLSSKDKTSWDRITEQQRMGAKWVWGVRLGEGRDPSPVHWVKISSWDTDPFFLAGAYVCFTLHVSFKCKPGSPTTSPGKVGSRMLACLCYHHFAIAYSQRPLPPCLCFSWTCCLYLLCIMRLSSNRGVMDGWKIKEKITVLYC